MHISACANSVSYMTLSLSLSLIISNLHSSLHNDDEIYLHMLSYLSSLSYCQIYILACSASSLLFSFNCFSFFFFFNIYWP